MKRRTLCTVLVLAMIVVVGSARGASAADVAGRWLLVAEETAELQFTQAESIFLVSNVDSDGDSGAVGVTSDTLVIAVDDFRQFYFGLADSAELATFMQGFVFRLGEFDIQRWAAMRISAPSTPTVPDDPTVPGTPTIPTIPGFPTIPGLPTTPGTPTPTPTDPAPTPTSPTVPTPTPTVPTPTPTVPTPTPTVPTSPTPTAPTGTPTVPSGTTVPTGQSAAPSIPRRFIERRTIR